MLPKPCSALRPGLRKYVPGSLHAGDGLRSAGGASGWALDHEECLGVLPMQSVHKVLLITILFLSILKLFDEIVLFFVATLRFESAQER